MRLVTVFLLAVFFATPSIAQKYDAEFGELKEADLRQVLEMKNYPADSSAGALILYEKGTINSTNERTKITYIRRVKIFKSSAVDEWSNLIRRVDTRGLTEVRGNSYSLVDGRVTKRSLNESNIFKTPFRHGLDEYRAAMPNVVPGAVLEFEFQTTLTQFYTYPYWVFQHSIPVLMSEFFVSGKIAFNSDVSGSVKPGYSYDKLRGIHHWWLQDAPAFHSETMMSHTNLYRASLNTFYESMSWRDQVPKIWKSGGIGLIINGKPSWNRTADQIVSGVTDPKARVKAVVTYVKENLMWDGTDDIEARNIERSLDEKTGSSADLNIYMITLLRKADVNVNPVFISTRDNGPYHEHFPTVEQFNYMIGQVTIGTDTIYLDATDRTLPYDVLPRRCLNSRGLVILSKDAKWVNFTSRARNRSTTESAFTLEPDGSLSGKVSRKAEGYTAHSWRIAHRLDPNDFISALAGNGWNVQAHEETNVSNVDQPFTIQYQLTTENQTTSSGNMLYVTPFVVSDTTNLFKSDRRLYPIDFVLPHEQVLIFNLSLPEGYIVEQLPESKVISMTSNSARAVFNFSTTGRQVQALSRVMINRTFFEAEEYQALKDFYQRVAARQAEQIVLKRN